MRSWLRYSSYMQSVPDEKCIDVCVSFIIIIIIIINFIYLFIHINHNNKPLHMYNNTLTNK